METKIIFNGKTYTKVEDMPEEVRQAYQQALAQKKRGTVSVDLAGRIIPDHQKIEPRVILNH